MEGEILLNYFLLSVSYQNQAKLPGRLEAFPYLGSQIPLALMHQACLVLQYLRNFCHRMTANTKLH